MVNRSMEWGSEFSCHIRRTVSPSRLWPARMQSFSVEKLCSDTVLTPATPSSRPPASGRGHGAYHPPPLLLSEEPLPEERPRLLFHAGDVLTVVPPCPVTWTKVR